MPTYRVVVEYDGTSFSGLQFQPEERTVAGELERALSALFAEPVKIGSAGRTDAGVHASGQVVSFTAERAFPIERLALALNANLPDDVSARHAAVVRDGFSARFDARERAYVYRIINSPHPSAIGRRFAHHVYRPIDARLANDVAQTLVGEHDFVSFCGVLPNGTTVRTVNRIAIERDADAVTIRIAGLGFLHRMVRISVGTIVEIATGRRDRADIPRILAALDRREAGYTAPACGLTLAGVRYDDFDSADV